MCSQTRNSCAKAFDNRSRSKNLKQKKSRWGQFDLPLLKASRVKDIVAEEFVQSTKVKIHSRSPAEQKNNKRRNNVLCFANRWNSYDG